MQFFEGLLLKMTGQKKEGNKLLRSIDSSVDMTEVNHDMNRFGRLLHNEGLDSYARMLYQECSKLHIFMNQYQRPVVTKDIDIGGK